MAQLVVRFVRDEEVASSSLATPTEDMMSMQGWYTYPRFNVLSKSEHGRTPGIQRFSTPAHLQQP